MEVDPKWFPKARELKLTQVAVSAVAQQQVRFLLLRLQAREAGPSGGRAASRAEPGKQDNSRKKKEEIDFNEENAHISLQDTYNKWTSSTQNNKIKQFPSAFIDTKNEASCDASSTKHRTTTFSHHHILSFFSSPLPGSLGPRVGLQACLRCCCRGSPACCHRQSHPHRLGSFRLGCRRTPPRSSQRSPVVRRRPPPTWFEFTQPGLNDVGIHLTFLRFDK